MFAFNILEDSAVIIRINYDGVSLETYSFFEVYKEKKLVYSKKMIGISSMAVLSNNEMLLYYLESYKLYNIGDNQLYDVSFGGDFLGGRIRKYSNRHVLFLKVNQTSIGEVIEIKS